MATEFSLKIHADICSHFELGQCLLCLFCFSSTSLNQPCPHPIYRENAIHTYRDRGHPSSWPLLSVHSSSNTGVCLFILSKTTCAFSFFPSAIIILPLYSLHSHLKDVQNLLWTEACPLDLALQPSMSSVTVTCTVWPSSVENFLPADKQ